MFGMKDLEKALNSLGNKIAEATVEGIEKGAKIIADILAEKLDELHEREGELSLNRACNLSANWLKRHSLWSHRLLARISVFHTEEGRSILPGTTNIDGCGWLVVRRGLISSLEMDSISIRPTSCCL